MDLATEWRSRRWRRLLSFIDGLPRNSEFVQALTEDEDLAAHLLDNPPPDDAVAVRMADWSPELEALHLAIDRLGDVVKAVVASIPKARMPRIPPMPRPTTAVDRLRQQRRSTAHRTLVARVLPNQPPP